MNIYCSARRPRPDSSAEAQKLLSAPASSIGSNGQEAELESMPGGSPAISRRSIKSTKVDASINRGSINSGSLSAVPGISAFTTSDEAIAAYAVRKSYGSGKNRVIVLKDLDLVHPRGKIYGLLGPSGCGKSTFLKCVTGRLRVTEGKLEVFGKKPGTKGHSVPGRLLGYMPQEEALYQEFTVDETLAFFGSLHGIGRKALDRKRTFLYGLLELEGISDRLISKLSGGQKRRVSFACALIHNPQLLVLDEPTVGVDPLLRAKIWAYLQHLTAMPGGPSILITTHYIEEARQADIVGMMRDGNLLAEDSPELLLQQYHCNSLEEVFLLLCRGHGKFTITDGSKPLSPQTQ